MVSALIRGFLAVVFVLSATAVLVDSWVSPSAFVDPDGEGPQAPVPNPEVADQRTQGNRIHLDVLAPPPLALSILMDVATSELAPSEERRRITVRLKPADPSGWLGRRHRRPHA